MEPCWLLEHNRFSRENHPRVVGMKGLVGLRGGRLSSNGKEFWRLCCSSIAARLFETQVTCGGRLSIAGVKHSRMRRDGENGWFGGRDQDNGKASVRFKRMKRRAPSCAVDQTEEKRAETNKTFRAWARLETGCARRY